MCLTSYYFSAPWLGCGNVIKRRKNVNALDESEKQALRSAMQEVIDNGYFGHIANYHGAPLTICNHLNTTGGHVQDKVGGCCPHRPKFEEFLTWHRLYVVIMEKVGRILPKDSIPREFQGNERDMNLGSAFHLT